MSANPSKPFARKGILSLHVNAMASRIQFDIPEKTMAELLLFKANEKKDDPARLQGIHGPYEESHLRRTGTLPPDYFEKGDYFAWGLRVKDSRSNILWQVLSGVMDRDPPEFGTAYMALAMDHTLSDNDYVLELKKLNKDWSNYLEHSASFGDHHHHAMKNTYTRMACPACSMLTALACQDAGMQSIFQELLPLKTADRRALLVEKGLMPLLDTMLPQPPTAPKP